MSKESRAEMQAIKALLDIRDLIIADSDFSGAIDHFERALDGMSSALRPSFEKAMTELIEASADEAFLEFAIITNNMKPLSKGFEIGKSIADDGRKKQFFPSAATHLAQVSSVIVEIKKATDEISENIDELRASFVKNDAKRLIKEGKLIKENLEDLLSSFESLNEGFQD